MANGQVTGQGQHQGQKKTFAIIMKGAAHMRGAMASSDMCAPFVSGKDVVTPHPEVKCLVKQKG